MSNVHYEINVHKNDVCVRVYFFVRCTPSNNMYYFWVAGCLKTFTAVAVMWGFYFVIFFSIPRAPMCSAERVRFTCYSNNSVPPVNVRQLPPLSKFTPVYYSYYINISFLFFFFVYYYYYYYFFYYYYLI
jgi:hypothetical protein